MSSARRSVMLLVVTLGGLLSIVSAVAVNVATSRGLPRALEPYERFAWPTVGVLVVATVVLAVWQFGTDHGDGAEASSASISPAELPPDIAEFTGRKAELDELRRHLSTRRESSIPTLVISAIDGKPGVGKSALAVHLAHELASSYPDAQLYANLRGAESEALRPSTVLGQFLRALGMPGEDIPADPHAASRHYRSMMAEKRALVLLDNATDAEHVRPLLPASPTCLVLITSRTPLAALEGTTSLTLEALDEREAVELLGRLAGKARIKADPAAAAVIARQCGYLPLALRIAGARLRQRPTWTIETLTARLADERHRLEELQVGNLAVEASFALSYQELDAYDARTFRMLGLLDGPDTTAETVAALIDGTIDAAGASLERLTDAQLLETPRPNRYRFHDLLRLYASKRLEAEESEEERQNALDRVLKLYLVTVCAANRHIKPSNSVTGNEDQFETLATALDWLEVERPNLIAAVQQASRHGQLANAWQLAVALVSFFDFRKYWAEWRDTSKLGLAAARQIGDRLGEARSLVSLSTLDGDLRRFDSAIEYCNQSLEIYATTNDREGEGTALRVLGRHLREQYRHDEARRYLTQSLKLFRAIRDHAGEAQTLMDLGLLCSREHRFGEALACYQPSLKVFRAIGDRRNEGRTLIFMSLVYQALQRFNDAIICCQQSLTICREIGDRDGEARTLTYLGNAYTDLRDVDQAIECYEQSLLIRREIHFREGEGWTLYQLGRAYTQRRRFSEAIKCFEESLSIHRELGDRFGEAVTLMRLGDPLQELGEHDSARNSWQGALAILNDLGAPEAAEAEARLRGARQ
jgi:tetratricopeptide (TPR) repeat protein